MPATPYTARAVALAPHASAPPRAAAPAPATVPAAATPRDPAPAPQCGGDVPGEVAALRAAPASAQQPWTALSPSALRDLRAGKPLVVYVLVPLCSNAQIGCGSRAAGSPIGLDTNLYWGAIFGARTFFDRYQSPFERVSAGRAEAPHLERIVYRQRVPAAPFGLAPSETVEQLVVLQAVHGAHINQAVEEFWNTATRGGCVSFDDGAKRRTERIHVVGYAGHNRLMDGVKLPSAPSPAEASPIPSFVLACFSERYFGPALRAAGARPLLTTRVYMAPEGYLVRAVAESLARNESPAALFESAAVAQRAWQRSLSPFQSRFIFWPFEP